MFIFTGTRLIFIRSLTGKKIEIQSVPYKSIACFSIKTTAHTNLDDELKIWLLGEASPIKKSFNKSVNIYEIQAALAEAVVAAEK